MTATDDWLISIIISLTISSPKYDNPDSVLTCTKKKKNENDQITASHDLNTRVKK